MEPRRIFESTRWGLVASLFGLIVASNAVAQQCPANCDCAQCSAAKAKEGEQKTVSTSAKMTMHETGMFMGAKANTGRAMHATVDGKQILTLSDDFVTPETPAPHWQVVDAEGNVYLLQRLKIKGDKFNKSITLPSYIRNVAKVQIWCAWAETLLGEASFEEPVQ